MGTTYRFGEDYQRLFFLESKVQVVYFPRPMDLESKIKVHF